MSDRLKYLLSRFLEKEASAGETEELREMAALPEHADYIREQIESAFDTKKEQISLDPNIGKQIYGRIKDDLLVQPARRIWWRSFGTMAAAASITLALGLGWYFYGHREVQRTGSVAAYATGETTRVYRNKSYVRLPDGSTIMLKDSSELIALERNGKFIREVILKGEAYFDIAHDASHTFVVHAGKVHTRVLGTAFNIRAHSKNVEVIVTRGLVEVASEKKILGKIQAREQINVNTDSDLFHISQVKAVEKTVKTQVVLRFNEATMSEIFDLIGKRFNYQIFLENPEIGTCRLSADLSGLENLEQVMEAICATRNLEFTTELDKILIRGGTPCR